MSSIKICNNGHCFIGDLNDSNNCPQCGELLNTKCGKCKSEFNREFIQDIPTGNSINYRPPYYCDKCGESFPWTNKIIDSAYKLIMDDEELDNDSKELLKSTIPNLIVEKQETSVAVSNYKKTIKKGSVLLGNLLQQLLVSVISENVKKLLFNN